MSLRTSSKQAFRKKDKHFSINYVTSKFDEIEEPPKGMITAFPESSTDQNSNVTDALSRLYRILGTTHEGTDVCIDEKSFIYGTTIWGFEVYFSCLCLNEKFFSMAHRKSLRLMMLPRLTPALSP